MVVADNFLQWQTLEGGGGGVKGVKLIYSSPDIFHEVYATAALHGIFTCTAWN